jgi:hypothetical protein
MCLTFSAIYLLGNKSRAGFVVMMVGNLCWAAIGVWAHSYAMILANLGFFSMNIRGFMKWAPPPAVEVPNPSFQRTAAPPLN